MAFNPLLSLEKGDVDFIYKWYDSIEYSTSMIEDLIDMIRRSPRRVFIVDGFLTKLMDDLPGFCFEVICDMREYGEQAKYLLDNYYSPRTISKTILIRMSNVKELFLPYLLDNIDLLLERFQDDLDFIFDFMFVNMSVCIQELDRISVHHDLHIRCLFMKYLISNYPDLLSIFYDDLTKYLTSVTYKVNEQLSLFIDYMDQDDASSLAVLILNSGLDEDLWTRMKEYVMETYKYNNLAKYLLQSIKVSLDKSTSKSVVNEKGINEFNKDADRLFNSAEASRYKIYADHGESISLPLMMKYRDFISKFSLEGKVDPHIRWGLDYHGLSRKLEEYTEKYLELSNRKDSEYISSGSTASVYRIGDYAFKLESAKWSYEDEICPNLYIIAPNLEEDFVRDANNVVVSGIEVQKFYLRSAESTPNWVFQAYLEELDRLGYFFTDVLYRGDRVNCKLLDDYTESGNMNPPEWFKKWPLVLIDRDRVYRKGREPKQLKNSVS